MVVLPLQDPVCRLRVPLFGVYGAGHTVGSDQHLRVQKHQQQELEVGGCARRNITIFLYTVVGNLILRIAMYTVCGVIMKGYARDYYIIDETQKKDALCNAIYPSSLYIMQGCLEGLVCVIILVMSKSVAAYIASKDQVIQSGKDLRLTSTSARHLMRLGSIDDSVFRTPILSCH